MTSVTVMVILSRPKNFERLNTVVAKQQPISCHDVLVESEPLSGSHQEMMINHGEVDWSRTRV